MIGMRKLILIEYGPVIQRCIQSCFILFFFVITVLQLGVDKYP